MNTKFFNDAVIGNKNIKATFSDRGEMLRIYYPNVDYKQFVDTFQVGLKINDSAIVYLHEDINNKYKRENNARLLNHEFFLILLSMFSSRNSNYCFKLFKQKIHVRIKLLNMHGFSNQCTLPSYFSSSIHFNVARLAFPLSSAVPLGKFLVFS